MGLLLRLSRVNHMPARTLLRLTLGLLSRPIQVHFGLGDGGPWGPRNEAGSRGPRGPGARPGPRATGLSQPSSTVGAS